MYPPLGTTKSPEAKLCAPKGDPGGPQVGPWSSASKRNGLMRCSVAPKPAKTAPNGCHDQPKWCQKGSPGESKLLKIKAAKLRFIFLSLGSFIGPSWASSRNNLESHSGAKQPKPSPYAPMLWVHLGLFRERREKREERKERRDEKKRREKRREERRKRRKERGPRRDKREERQQNTKTQENHGTRGTRRDEREERGVKRRKARREKPQMRTFATMSTQNKSPIDNTHPNTLITETHAHRGRS